MTFSSYSNSHDGRLNIDNHPSGWFFLLITKLALEVVADSKDEVITSSISGRSDCRTAICQDGY